MVVPDDARRRGLGRVRLLPRRPRAHGARVPRGPHAADHRLRRRPGRRPRSQREGHPGDRRRRPRDRQPQLPPPALAPPLLARRDPHRARPGRGGDLLGHRPAHDGLPRSGLQPLRRRAPRPGRPRLPLRLLHAAVGHRPARPLVLLPQRQALARAARRAELPVRRRPGRLPSPQALRVGGGRRPPAGDPGHHAAAGPAAHQRELRALRRRVLARHGAGSTSPTRSACAGSGASSRRSCSTRSTSSAPTMSTSSGSSRAWA